MATPEFAGGRRTTSTARIEANRRNARLSTGPRTPEGKSVSRFNGLKHGCCAKAAVLPGEDAEVRQRRLEAWLADLGAATEPERYLVASAVDASWRMDRSRLSETAALTDQVNKVEEGFDDALA